MRIGEDISGAQFSDDRRFRFKLWRVWDKSKGKLLFIGLNPSIANETREDPTIFRVVEFAKRWEFGGLYVGNIYAFITPYPEELSECARDAFLIETDQALKEMKEDSATVMVGWGERGKRVPDRIKEIMNLVGPEVYCLAVTKSGQPSHPLYLPAHYELKLYEEKATKK